MIARGRPHRAAPTNPIETIHKKQIYRIVLQNLLNRRTLSCGLWSGRRGSSTFSPLAKIIVPLGPYPAANSPPDCWIELFEPLGQKRKTTLSCGLWSGRRGSNSLPPPWQGGALPDELRPHLWCPRSESNQRHADFQSAALPTELQRQMATTKGLEPSTSGVTGRRSNQLNYRAT